MPHQSKADSAPGLILVVDDNPTNRYVISTTLRRSGHRVTEAQDGAGALALLATADPLPDAAVIDVRLPDMTGFDVCEAIKNNPATAFLPVIHISASAISVADRTQGLNRGADAYLTEPIAPAELLATVTANVRYARARRRAERLAQRLHRLYSATLTLYAARQAAALATEAARGAAEILETGAVVLLTSPHGETLVAHADARHPDRAGFRPVLSAVDLPAHPPAAGRVTLRTVPAADWPYPIEDRTAGAYRVAVATAKPVRPPVRIVVPETAVAGPDDEELLTQLVHTCALALEALRAYHEEHELALALQRSFLPDSLPATERTDLAVRYLPASEYAEIGGDFYEALSTADGLLIAVGDVAGHSLDAAMVMGQLRHALRAYATEGHPPQAILTRLDHLLATVCPGATATLCLVLIEHRNNRIRIANAGHLPPLLRGPGIPARYVREHGPLLGLALPHPDPVTVEAPPGTSVLLVTDGLIERRHEDIEQSLATLLAEAATVPDDPESTCAQLLERFPPDGGDDVALMAVRLREPLPPTGD
ncbi:fused response regulator/phosphatase [Streptomyces sp. NPDC020875]|uniref:fused response regulator/phosphatase n=1 Tax=Streptomyces sp. NPDC020875 TaxID=3154898 RepID=UPI003410882A